MPQRYSERLAFVQSEAADDKTKMLFLVILTAAPLKENEEEQDVQVHKGNP